jgi:hypothetical protein
MRAAALALLLVLTTPALLACEVADAAPVEPKAQVANSRTSCHSTREEWVDQPGQTLDQYDNTTNQCSTEGTNRNGVAVASDGAPLVAAWAWTDAGKTSDCQEAFHEKDVYKGVDWWQAYGDITTSTHCRDETSQRGVALDANGATLASADERSTQEGDSFSHTNLTNPSRSGGTTTQEGRWETAKSDALVLVTPAGERRLYLSDCHSLNEGRSSTRSGATQRDEAGAGECRQGVWTTESGAYARCQDAEMYHQDASTSDGRSVQSDDCYLTATGIDVVQFEHCERHTDASGTTQTCRDGAFLPGSTTGVGLQSDEKNWATWKVSLVANGDTITLVTIPTRDLAPHEVVNDD